MVVPRVEDEMYLKPVKVDEIKKIIRKMKNSNTRGDSELTNGIVKNLIDYLSLAITHLANVIFRTGIYPAALKHTRILPLKKRGKEDDSFESYRPINNLNPISKIIDETIRERIDHHLVSKKILPNLRLGIKPQTEFSIRNCQIKNQEGSFG